MCKIARFNRTHSSFGNLKAPVLQLDINQEQQFGNDKSEWQWGLLWKHEGLPFELPKTTEGL